MRLVLTDNILTRDPPGFDLPDVTISTYATNAYSSAHLIGITPAQLHDAIGCPKAEASEIEKLLRQIADARPAVVADVPGQSIANVWARCSQKQADLARVALALLAGRHPCADCDSGAPDIAPHDCPNTAKEAR